VIKQSPYRNKKTLQAARGQDCTLNSTWCNYDPATTVFCHLNGQFAGKGMGIKADDFAGFDGCSGCHQAYDSGLIDDYQSILMAVVKTLKRRFNDGIIK